MPFPNVWFLGVMSQSKINSYYFHRMNTRRDASQRRGGAAAGDNMVPPQALTEWVAMSINPAWFTYVDVRASLEQMKPCILMKSQAMTYQVNLQNVQRKNPLVRSMDDMLWDFTRMNPSKTLENPQEFVAEAHKIFVAMGPYILRKQSCLPINSKMLHKLGASCDRIAELWIEFWSLGSRLR